MPEDTFIRGLEDSFAKADAEHTLATTRVQESANRRMLLLTKLETARANPTVDESLALSAAVAPLESK